MFAYRHKCRRETETCSILPVMNRSCRLIWVPLLSLVFCLPGTAATVYKSVDENGVVVFSDSPPAEDVAVETLVIDAQAPQQSPLKQQRLEEMRETTDRMVADRMAREKHRAEIEKLQAETQAELSAQEFPDYYESSTVYSGYYGFPSRRYWRHPNKPRPIQPIVRPPLQNRPVGVRPLPGNNYPASLIRKSYDPKVRETFR